MIENGRRVRFGHHQRKNYFKFRVWSDRICAAMKAPVGLLSGRAVCVSRWRGFAPTSSAERSKRIFTGGVVEGNSICSAAFCESAALRESTASLRPLRRSRARFPLLSPTVTSSPGAGEVFPQRESQAVKFITKVLGVIRKYPAVLLALPLGELAKPSGFD